jgi:hypothetical protein
MTVTFMIGRRIPRNFFKRSMQKLSNVLTFQEHIWYIINNSLKLAKRKAKKGNPNLLFTIERYEENEDINYIIQWSKVIIKGTEKEEEDEYNDLLKFYDPLNKVFDKNKMVNDKKTSLAAMFKSKVVDITEIEKMYKKGMDNTGEHNISNKLLEIGIMSNFEWVKDQDIL